MIDKSAFNAGLAILAAAFSRDLDEATIVAYYRVLNPRLSTAEFQTAVQVLLDTETFWPAPAKIIHAVHPPDAAQKALGRVLERLRQAGGHLYLPHSEFQKFSAAEKAGIKSAGGLAKITNTSMEHMGRLERAFAEGYESVAGSSRLEAGDPEPPRRIGRRSQPTDIAKIIPLQTFGDRS